MAKLVEDCSKCPYMTFCFRDFGPYPKDCPLGTPDDSWRRAFKRDFEGEK